MTSCVFGAEACVPQSLMSTWFSDLFGSRPSFTFTYGPKNGSSISFVKEDKHAELSTHLADVLKKSPKQLFFALKPRIFSHIRIVEALLKKFDEMARNADTIVNLGGNSPPSLADEVFTDSLEVLQQKYSLDDKPISRDTVVFHLIEMASELGINDIRIPLIDRFMGYLMNHSLKLGELVAFYGITDPYDESMRLASSAMNQSQSVAQGKKCKISFLNQFCLQMNTCP